MKKEHYYRNLSSLGKFTNKKIIHSFITQLLPITDIDHLFKFDNVFLGMRTLLKMIFLFLENKLSNKAYIGDNGQKFKL